jgi:hypothetical protein
MTHLLVGVEVGHAGAQLLPLRLQVGVSGRRHQAQLDGRRRRRR